MAASQPGPRYNGLRRDPATGAVDLYQGGVKAFAVTGNDVVVTDALTSNSLAVVTGAVSIDEIAYTFPATDGSNTNQLTTNGSGVLAWLPADDGAA